MTQAATPLVMARRGGGRMNLAPALSPDGRRLLFFSERGQVSIELYLADAVTGEVLHALTRSAVDPEIQNLGFIHSAGEWSPEGDRFVIATASRGRPVLSVMDVRERARRCAASASRSWARSSTRPGRPTDGASPSARSPAA